MKNLAVVVRRCVASVVLSVALLMCAASEVKAQLVPAYAPSNGLVGWWPFDGNAEDAGPNNYDFVVSGAVPDNDGVGDASTSYSFDGIDDWMTLDRTIFRGQVPMTYAFWLRTDKAGAMDVVGQTGDWTNWSDFRIALNSALCGIKGLTFWQVSHFTTVPFETNDNQWHHYAVVMGANGNYQFNNIRFFIDGVLQPVTGPYGQCPHNWGGWQYNIGWDIWNNQYVDRPMDVGQRTPGHYDLKGRLDELGIWSRALTDDEVATLYRRIVILQQPSAVIAAGGHPASFDVDASAYDGISYQWQRKDGGTFSNVIETAGVSGAQSATLAFSEAKKSLAGAYRCALTAAGVTIYSDEVTLTVTCPCNQ